jgi:hypothetical protein
MCPQLQKNSITYTVDPSAILQCHTPTQPTIKLTWGASDWVLTLSSIRSIPPLCFTLHHQEITINTEMLSKLFLQFEEKVFYQNFDHYYKDFEWFPMEQPPTLVVWACTRTTSACSWTQRVIECTDNTCVLPVDPI